MEKSFRIDYFNNKDYFQGVVMAFLDKMKEYLDKGVEVSKEALSKAGDAVQDFSDKSVTKIETHQLISRQNKEYRALGQAVLKFFEENPSASLSADNSLISGIMAEIQRLEKEIVQREESLKAKEQDESLKAKEQDDTTASSQEDDETAPKDTSVRDTSVFDTHDASALKAEATDAEFTKS